MPYKEVVLRQYRKKLQLALLLLLIVRPDVGVPQQGQKVIDIHAKRFAFVPDHITLAKGETVTLRFTSEDVPHGLVVPGLGIRVSKIVKGKPTDITDTPPKTGDFAGSCSRYCGVGHHDMHFLIHVVEK